MSWVIKILNRNFNKVEKVWNGSNFDDTVLGPADFMINDFQFSESTWREVEYETVEQEILVHRIQTTSDIIMTSDSRRYQFIEPLVEEIFLTLPSIPRFNERYIVKNLSEVNNLIHIREVIDGPTLITLDSLDEYTTLFHDSVEWHAQI